MAVWDKKILWSFMFLLADAVVDRVHYPPSVCAVKGSTVTVPCSFTPAEDLGGGFMEVIRVVWCQNHEICHGSTPSVFDSNQTTRAQRYRYLGDMKGNCTLQITGVRKSDEAVLRFRMEAKTSRGHFTGKPGVKVAVIEGTRMKIRSPSGDGQMRGGENVTLSCTSTCTFHQLEVIWLRDGHTLSESGPALWLGPLTAEDSGNYTCRLRTNSGSLSQPYSLHVEAEEEASEASDGLPLLVGVVFGVLLALFTLVMVSCIIRRRRAADQRRSGGDEVEQKDPDPLYSNIQVTAEPPEQGGAQPGLTVEDISYASVQFRHKKHSR
ncbi:uncharacterized protein [Pempheris klunzingeri]|uniref:uncharacterized protein n=1 Tax=Pempheris klunzingeri TaxID=3127111 RepID=UPI00397FF35A